MSGYGTKYTMFYSMTAVSKELELMSGYGTMYTMFYSMTAVSKKIVILSCNNRSSRFCHSDVGSPII